MRELKKKVVNEFHGMISDVMEVLRTAQETGQGVDLTTLPESAVSHLNNLSDFFEEMKSNPSIVNVGSEVVEKESWFEPKKVAILFGIGLLCLVLGLLFGVMI